MTQQTDTPASYSPPDRWMVLTLFALAGAFFWAIRGTTGYGGSDGGVLAGLGWGALWLALSGLGGQQRLYGSPRILAAITLGIAFGGMTGYGVYIAWVQGRFYLDYPEGVRAIAPWTGYAMLFFCGLHWGGVTGALMSWCAPRVPLGWRGWGTRIGMGILGAVLAGVIVRVFPQLFLPFFEEGLYDIEEYRTCRRALASIRTIAPHVGLFLGFLVFETLRRDWRAVSLMLVMGLGFAIPFTIGGYWHTFNGSTLPIDWWKNWEMSIGLGGGLSFGFAFLLFNRVVDTPRPIRAIEMILGGGFPLWIGSTMVFSNALQGLIKLHHLEPFASVQVALSWTWFLVAGGCMVWWSRSVIRTPHAKKAIPNKVLLTTLALIMAAGFTVSIPQPVQLGHWVLLGLYALYTVGATGLFYTLKRRTGGG